jgi:hypothetical protein
VRAMKWPIRRGFAMGDYGVTLVFAWVGRGDMVGDGRLGDGGCTFGLDACALGPISANTLAVIFREDKLFGLSKRDPYADPLVATGSFAQVLL